MDQDYERAIAKQIQERKVPVDGPKLLNELDLSTSKSSSVGQYSGSTKNPTGGVQYTGSQMKSHWPRHANETKFANSGGGGLGCNQAKAKKGKS